MTTPSIAVVIPSWNGRPLLEACLAGLAVSTIDTRIIVVDNGSTDGTAEWLSASHPTVSVIRNARNLGFAAAVNQGIRASAGPWVALLNNDAVPSGDWLEALLAVGESGSRIGAVASRMMFRDAPGVVCSAGVRVDASLGAWDLYVGRATWPGAPSEVFGASAGACLYRRAMLQDIGLFDEGYFAYLEDVDLAWRARLRRWIAVLAPGACVVHAVSATSGEASPFKRYHLARNKWRTIVRCVPSPVLASCFPVVLAYDGLSIGNSIVSADRAALRGRLAVVPEMASLLRQRARIQASRTAGWRELQGALSPLESPLTLHQRAKLVATFAGHSR